MNHINPRDARAESTRCLDAVLLDDWHVVAFSDEVTRGRLVPATLLECDLVLWRDSAGEVHAWEDQCVHRGARLSKGVVRDDKVICPYHGWNYDGLGQCVFIPAAPNDPPFRKARLRTHHVRERYGFVWVSLGEPANDIPVFPEWDDPAYKKVLCGPYRFKSGYRALENFFDPSHFPFVHAGVNGIQDAPDPIAPFEVHESDQGIASSEVRVTQPYGDPREVPVTAYYAYQCFRPLVAYFKKRVVIIDPARAAEGNPDDRFCTFLTAQAVDEVTSIVRICCAMNFSPLPSDEDVRRRQDLVYAQDSAIVDIQRPERISLDLRDEVHRPSDLMGLKYRGWLRRMGVTYGTCR